MIPIGRIIQVEGIGRIRTVADSDKFMPGIGFYEVLDDETADDAPDFDEEEEEEDNEPAAPQPAAAQPAAPQPAAAQLNPTNPSDIPDGYVSAVHGFNSFWGGGSQVLVPLPTTASEIINTYGNRLGLSRTDNISAVLKKKSGGEPVTVQATTALETGVLELSRAFSKQA